MTHAISSPGPRPPRRQPGTTEHPPRRVLAGLVGQVALLICMTSLVDVIPVAAQRTVDAVIELADRLKAEGRLEDAIETYRSLRDRHPGRTDVIFRLEALLMQAARYQEAADLMAERLESAPVDLTANLRLGDALHKLGRSNEAFQHWNRILEGATREGPFALAADRYRKHNLYEEAAGIYRRGRGALKKPDAFARELAELAEARSDYREAVSEYLVYLGAKPQYASLVESRITEFAGSGETGEVLQWLAAEVRQRPGDAARSRLLTSYAVAAGMPDSALTVLRGLPPSEGLNAQVSRIGAWSLEAERFEPARVAYEMLLELIESPAGSPEGLLGLARAHEGLARSGTAQALYSRVLDEHANTAAAHEAAFRLGRLQQTAGNDENAALVTFGHLAESKRRTAWRYRALLALSDILFRRNQTDDAVAACRKALKEQRGRDTGDEALLRIAEYRFLDGDFESSRLALDRLLKGSIQSAVLNDALEMSLLIDIGLSGDHAVIRAFAQALKLKRQGKTKQAIEGLEGLLARYPNTDLADRVVAAQVDLYVAASRFPDAIQACRRLRSAPFETPLRPWAQLSLGEIYERHLGQYHEAQAAYEAVLVDFPESLEADRARERLRRLEPLIEAPGSAGREAG